MLNTNLNPTLSTSFLLSTIILFSFPAITQSDVPCAYPCYPPPTGTGGATPTTPSGTITPPPPSQTGTIYPPPSGNPGYYPYNPPPPYGSDGDDGGNGGVYGTPPPPDPILPYFPFYYRKPPHRTEENSAATALQKWTWMIATTSLFSLLLLFE